MEMKLSHLLTRRTPTRLMRVFKSALVDLLVILLAYSATLLVWSLDTAPDYGASLRLLAVISVVTLGMLYIFGVYQRLWSRTSGHEVMVVVNATLASLLVVVLYLLLTRQDTLPIPVLLMGHVLCLTGFVAVRYRSRLASSFSWRWNAVIRREFPKARTRVLIVGAGESGQALAWRLKHRFGSSSYQVVGFIDDDPDKQDMFVEGCRILGGRDEIITLADSHAIDLIVVAIHNISGPDFRKVLAACEQTKAMVKVVPDLQELVSGKQHATLLRDVQAEDLIGRSPITRHEAVDLAPVTHKVILVTGAAGSIGSELSRQIMLYHPTTAILLDNNESGLHDLITELSAKYPDINVIPALVDITVRGALAAVFDTHRPQIVFHAAAYKHVPMLEHYPHEALRVNVGGTRNVAELARDFGVERFVLISTDKAVNPSSVMGSSKRACELLLHALSADPACTTRFAAVRFGNVLGSRGSVVPTFSRQIDSGGPVTVTHQEMTRYFMSIPEAVNLIIHAACLTQGSDLFVLRMGEVVRIVELAERMIRLRGLRPYQDVEIRFTGIRPGEKMPEELFLGAEQPVETIHPSILQVPTASVTLDAAAFRAQLDALLTALPDEAPTALNKRLRALIQPQQHAAPATLA